MAASRTTFEKLQRDRAKKAKAEAKRSKRLGRAPDGSPLPGATEDEDENTVQLDGDLDKEISPADLLRLVEELQRAFDNEEITFDEYEERKIELLARISAD